jgi:hypothetical protein
MLEPLRLAIRDVIERNPARLSAKEIARRLERALSTIYSWGETCDTGRDVTVADLVRLTLVTEDARPLGVVCDMAGGAFVRLPRGASEEVDAALVAVIRDFGATAEEVAKDLRDGRITRAELSRIRADIHDVQHALVQLLSAVEARGRRDEEREKRR